MTNEEATLIRKLRVDQHLTWRRVAEEYSAAQGEEQPWRARNSDQFTGMTLCADAARQLGEDPSGAPWN